MNADLICAASQDAKLEIHNKGRVARRVKNRLIEETTGGFSSDKHKRRRQHRTAARELLRSGILLNGISPVGSIPWSVAQWHLKQARNYKR